MVSDFLQIKDITRGLFSLGLQLESNERDRNAFVVLYVPTYFGFARLIAPTQSSTGSFRHEEACVLISPSICY